MKVTNSIISIPPYISTSWASVQAIHMSDDVLVVTLVDGDSVYVPGLTSSQITQIFDAHRCFLEEEVEMADVESEAGGISSFLGENHVGGLAEQLGRAGAIDGLTAVLQHNPSQANAPDLPKEMLDKVASIAKIMGDEEGMEVPKPEPHCNCMFCQIARTIAGVSSDEEVQFEEMTEPNVDDDELTFRQWDIHQEGDQLYTVTSRLDPDEKYSVYLGEPVGCTCGKPGCEHIVAVLQS